MGSTKVAPAEWEFSFTMGSQKVAPEGEIALDSVLQTKAVTLLEKCTAALTTDGKTVQSSAQLQDSTGGHIQTAGLVQPNEDIARFRPPNQFSLSGPLVHVFISYRAASEKTISDALYQALGRQSKESMFIPPGARGRLCPLIAAPTCEPHVCKVFLDKHGLLDGRDWEAGFVLALAHSIVVVPLLTWGSSDTGSVGQMVSLHGDTDREDNVLLEFILALSLKRHVHGSVQAIYPVLIGARKADDSFAEFPFSQLQRLPVTPSILTNTRAATIMKMLGLPRDLIDDMTKLSVREVIDMILRSQGCKLSGFDVSSAWQDECAVKVLKLLLREVHTLLDAPTTFSTTRPCADEMIHWLAECGLQQLESVFISSGLGSLQGVATISSQRLRELCLAFSETRPDATGLRFPEDLFARFEVARNRLKKYDLRARSMNVRLNRFVDNKVSWAAAFSSTSSVEIAASGWLPQIFVSLLLGFHVSLFIGNREPALKWQGHDRHVPRWAAVYVYQLVYLIMSVGLAMYILVGRFFARPYLAKNLLESACLTTAAVNALAPFVEFAQFYSGAHALGWSFSLYLWNTEVNAGFYSLFLYEVVWSSLYCALALVIRRRQELVCALIYGCVGVLLSERLVRQYAFDDLRYSRDWGLPVLQVSCHTHRSPLIRMRYMLSYT